MVEDINILLEEQNSEVGVPLEGIGSAPVELVEEGKENLDMLSSSYESESQLVE
jgi:hypothetical protein